MNRLISLEPSNIVAIRIEPGQKCSGELILRNVMHTMPVAFKLIPVHRSRYSVHPASAIIAPLRTLTVHIVFHLPPNSAFPTASEAHSLFPYSDDSFLLHSVVVPGADLKHAHDFLVPADWFTSKKKQVFTDTAIRVIFVGSPVLASLVNDGAMDDVREVLERSDPGWDPADSLDSDGRTLLHLAIARRRPDLVQLILEFGPDIEARCRQSGLSPLESACEAGEALIVELLLARKACTETLGGPCIQEDGSARSGFGLRAGPIHLAARNGHLDVLKLLIVKRAKVNALTNDGLTALHFAVGERRRDCARLLLANGAWTDVRGGVDGDTPLHIAAALGDENMVKILLHKGANKDVRNNAGKMAYDVAAENGHVRLYDALLLGDRLCSAAKRGEVRTVSRLLESGAVLNGRDQNGWTALHRASFYGRVETVRLLVERGADVEARDEEGYTPLHCAAEAGHGEVVEVLVKRGADLEAKTNKGASAMRIAEALGYGGIVRMLGHGVGGGVESDKGGVKKKRVVHGAGGGLLDGRSTMPLASMV